MHQLYLNLKKKKSQIPVSLNHSSGASHVQPGLRITRPQQQNFRNESKIVSCWVSLSSTCITRKLTGEQARFLWRSEPSATVSKGREHKPNLKGLFGQVPRFPYTDANEGRGHLGRVYFEGGESQTGLPWNKSDLC